MRIELEVADNKAELFFQLIKELKFVKRAKKIAAAPAKSKSKDIILEGLKEALEEVELHRQGKLEMKTLQQVLDEL